jgi:hypothetical protein
MPVRMTIAVAVLTVLGGTAFAAPAHNPSLVITVANDADNSASENQAIKGDEEQTNSPNAPVTEPSAPSASPNDSGQPMENKEYDRENNM